MQARPGAAWEKVGCNVILVNIQVSVPSVGTVMLVSSFNPTKARARDAELAGAGTTARKYWEAVRLQGWRGLHG